MDSLQYSLFQETWEQKALAWIHTPAGGEVANRFIRIAIGCLRRGQKVGAKAIAERLRWHYEIVRQANDDYAINNNYVSTLARFAMIRAVELKDFFQLREVGKTKNDKKVIILNVQHQKGNAEL